MFIESSVEMAPVIVLITGANRGIGKGLLERYLRRPKHIIIAATRDPEHITSKELSTLPKAEDTSLVVIKLDLLDPEGSNAAVKELAILGINHVDILIANAGIALLWVKVSEVRSEDLQKHMEVNVCGNIRLYQAFLPVLQKGKQPKWVTIGSCAGWLTVRIADMFD
jgi:norsolorinic acid ketoreductase